jgi:DNA polymerase (family 10)
MTTTLLVRNELIADALDQLAIMHETRQASRFRINAYRRASFYIRQLDRSIHEIWMEEGRKGLIDLPTIGRSIGSAIEEFIRTGRINATERWEADMTPEKLLGTVPGIGPSLARRLHEELGLNDLEELELAAYDGRLEEMEGFANRRITAIRQHLEVMLGRASRLRRARSLASPQVQDFAYDDPSVETLLAIDREYRQLAAAGSLPMIAPRRFNPEHQAWLPIFQSEEDGWLFTAMFSNTARAHQLGKTKDWVVIFFEKQGEQKQYTVVTEYQGKHKGKRVVRGREDEI